MGKTKKAHRAKVQKRKEQLLQQQRTLNNAFLKVRAMQKEYEAEHSEGFLPLFASDQRTNKPVDII
jgi:hypothetical protein